MLRFQLNAKILFFRIQSALQVCVEKKRKLELFLTSGQSFLPFSEPSSSGQLLELRLSSLLVHRNFDFFR